MSESVLADPTYIGLELGAIATHAILTSVFIYRQTLKTEYYEFGRQDALALLVTGPSDL